MDNSSLLVADGSVNGARLSSAHWHMLIEAQSTAVDLYARVFYSMTKDPDEKYACCLNGAAEAKLRLALQKLGPRPNEAPQQPTAAPDRPFFGSSVPQLNTWAERAVYSLLFENAAFLLLADMRIASDTILSTLLAEMARVKQEQALAGTRLLEALASSGATRGGVEQALSRLWPGAVQVFEYRDEAYLLAGERLTGGAILRSVFVSKIQRLLSALDLKTSAGTGESCAKP